MKTDAYREIGIRVSPWYPDEVVLKVTDTEVDNFISTGINKEEFLQLFKEFEEIKLKMNW